jgi:SOS-response transcriptional repressor LexA
MTYFQRAALNCIIRLNVTLGRPPSFRDIQKEMGLKSVSQVMQVVSKLKELNKIEKDSSKGIKITK